MGLSAQIDKPLENEMAKSLDNSHFVDPGGLILRAPVSDGLDADARMACGVGYIDISGQVRDLFPLQYILADGSGTLTNTGLTATCVITNPFGTSTPTAATGEIALTPGTIWSFSVTWDDALTSTYEFGSLTGATSALCFDTSGNNRHLEMTGFVDYSLACANGVVGSDWCNLVGSDISLALYYDAECTLLIPDGTLIPATIGGGYLPAYSLEA